jgi:hypothetical protein
LWNEAGDQPGVTACKITPDHLHWALYDRGFLRRLVRMGTTIRELFFYEDKPKFVGRHLNECPNAANSCLQTASKRGCIMKRTWMLAMVICLWANMSYAEPGSTIKYLMGENVTMFDFGLYQLEQQLEKSVDPKLIWITKTNYNWTENRIELLFITHHLADIQTEAAMQKACQAFVDQIRNEANPPLFKKVFSHRGFTKATAPKEIGESLVAITHIVVHGYYKDGQKLVCKAPLKGSTISFGD